jgi:hypothetical protein
MSYDINYIQTKLTNKIKKLKKTNNYLKYFLNISIIKCEHNNNYLIYIKNKYPNSNNIYIGFFNFSQNKIKLLKNSYDINIIIMINNELSYLM